MYEEKDFTALQFNPLTKKSMLKAYPRLSEITQAEADSTPFFDKVLRYISALYDPKSPLIQERDLNYRKTVAAQLSGFDLDSDEDFLQELYTSRVEWATVLTMRFLIRFIKQRKWAFMVSIETAYWENIQRIMKPVERGEGVRDWDELKSLEIKSKLKDEAEKDLKRLDILYAEFFNEDRDLEEAAKNTRMTPESVAKLNSN
jgi:hypothetical protein